MGWGAVIDIDSAYSADKSHGATLTTVPFAHATDALSHVLGEFREVTATRALRCGEFELARAGEIAPMTPEDQLAVAGILESGAVACVHFRGGTTRGGTELLWEINGTEGDIQITAAAGLVQMVPLTLTGARADRRTMEPLCVPHRYHHVAENMGAMVRNIAEAYWWLAQDISMGSRQCPSFDEGMARHRMLASVERAADTGRPQTLRFSRLSESEQRGYS